MELPINYKDLDTIVQSLSLGGDARLYHLLKGIRDDKRIEFKNIQIAIVKYMYTIAYFCFTYVH